MGSFTDRTSAGAEGPHRKSAHPLSCPQHCKLLEAELTSCLIFPATHRAQTCSAPHRHLHPMPAPEPETSAGLETTVAEAGGAQSKSQEEGIKALPIAWQLRKCWVAGPGPAPAPQMV